jgi:outer membrane protein TolC
VRQRIIPIIWLASSLAAAFTPALLATEGAAPTPDSGISAAIIESLEPTSLQRLATEVLDRNPDLSAIERRAASLEARIPQVRSLPDPMASLTPFLQSPETRVGPQRVSVGVSQRLPWFGKLDLREQGAMWVAVGARADVEMKRLSLIEETSRLFYELAFLDHWSEIVSRDRATLVHYEELARTRYAAGIGISQAPIKIQAEITKDQNRLIEIEKRRSLVVAAINALRDRPDAAEVETPALPRLGVLPVQPDSWHERAIAMRPDLVRAQAGKRRCSSTRGTRSPITPETKTTRQGSEPRLAYPTKREITNSKGEY